MSHKKAIEKAKAREAMGHGPWYLDHDYIASVCRKHMAYLKRQQKKG